MMKIFIIASFSLISVFGINASDNGDETNSSEGKPILSQTLTYEQVMEYYNFKKLHDKQHDYYFHSENGGCAEMGIPSPDDIIYEQQLRDSYYENQKKLEEENKRLHQIVSEQAKEIQEKDDSQNILFQAIKKEEEKKKVPIERMTDSLEIMTEMIRKEKEATLSINQDLINQLNEWKISNEAATEQLAKEKEKTKALKEEREKLKNEKFALKIREEKQKQEREKEKREQALKYIQDREEAQREAQRTETLFSLKSIKEQEKRQMEEWQRQEREEVARQREELARREQERTAKQLEQAGKQVGKESERVVQQSRNEVRRFIKKF